MDDERGAAASAVSPHRSVARASESHCRAGRGKRGWIGVNGPGALADLMIERLAD
jgi:hypothetical protein